MVSARPGARKTGASVNRFYVSVYAIRRRPGRRRPFEVRRRAAGRSRSKSFITRRLADSYRAELVRAARMGLDFDPLTGEPTAWNLPEPATVTWPRRPPQPADRPRPRALRMTWSVPVRRKPAATPDRATPRKPAVAPTARLREKASGCTDRDGRGRRPLLPRPARRRPADHVGTQRAQPPRR
jgi:hypothetical protein